MIAAPANTAMTSSVPANMAQMADRLVAHHMKRDASHAHRPAVAIIRIPVSIRSPEQADNLLNAPHTIRDPSLHRWRHTERLMNAVEIGLILALRDEVLRFPATNDHSGHSSHATT